jgi:hypothetical protein
MCTISAPASRGNGGGSEVARAQGVGGHWQQILSDSWSVGALCTNGSGESMEAGAVGVKSSSTPADGGKRFDLYQQLLQTHFYRGGVVGGGGSWTTIGWRQRRMNSSEFLSYGSNRCKLVCSGLSKNSKVAQPSALAQRKCGGEVGSPSGLTTASGTKRRCQIVTEIDVATLHVEGI